MFHLSTSLFFIYNPYYQLLTAFAAIIFANGFLAARK